MSCGEFIMDEKPIHQVYSTSEHLSMLNNVITKQLSNLCNSPTKLKTPLILPLLGYWSGGMRGAVGIRPPSPRGDGKGRVVRQPSCLQNPTPYHGVISPSPPAPRDSAEP